MVPMMFFLVVSCEHHQGSITNILKKFKGQAHFPAVKHIQVMCECKTVSLTVCRVRLGISGE